MVRVFLSHAGWLTKVDALRFKKILELYGISTFVDETDIHLSQDGGQVMQQNLEDAELFVVLLDAKCFPKSPFCMEELCFALDTKKRILPIFWSAPHKYPTSKKAITKLIGEISKWGDGKWTVKKFSRVLTDVLNLPGLDRWTFSNIFRDEIVVRAVRDMLQEDGPILQSIDQYTIGNSKQNTHSKTNLDMFIIASKRSQPDALRLVDEFEHKTFGSAYSNVRDMKTDDQLDEEELKLLQDCNGAIVVLFDADVFVDSCYCMQALKLALDSKPKQKVLIVFYSDLNEYTESEEAVKEIVDLDRWQDKSWSCKDVAQIVQKVKKFNGFRRHEDRRSFEEDVILHAVQEINQDKTPRNFRDYVTNNIQRNTSEK